jgi:hypothetical protein
MKNLVKVVDETKGCWTVQYVGFIATDEAEAKRICDTLNDGWTKGVRFQPADGTGWKCAPDTAIYVNRRFEALVASKKGFTKNTLRRCRS